MVTNVTTARTEGFEVVSLERAKQHLRIESDFNDDDDLIQIYIDAAVEASENYTNGAIAERIEVINLDRFDSPFIFEAFPLQSVETVKYYPGAAGDEVTMDAASYDLTKANSLVWNLRFRDSSLPATAERFDAVTIEIKTGYDADAIPKPIVAAVLLQVADMYERREDRSETLSTAAMALLRPYKKF